MKFVQVTRTLDTQTFEPISVITLEVPISEVRDHGLSDEEIERHIGKLFLNAMLEYIREHHGVTDVTAKAQEIREQQAKEEAHV